MAIQDGPPIIEQEKLLSQLLDISKQMSEIRQLGTLIDFIVDHMITLVNAERGYIVVKHDDKLEFKMSQTSSQQEMRNRIDQVSRSILEHVFKNEQSIRVKNAILDPRFSVATSVIKLRLRSVMCVPLITNDSIVGAFYVENRTESGIFSRRDLEILEFFSHHAAISILNANINDNLENLVQERTQQLEEAKNHAEQVSKAKSDFLAFISHELRSPLTGISIYAELLKQTTEGKLQQNQQRAIRHIIGSSDHILSLVNDLLDIDKIESGELDVVLTDVDIESIFQKLTPTIDGMLLTKPVTLTLKFAESLSLVRADEKRLHQIFLNVLTNAAKFTSEGHITVEASLVDEEYVLIRIEDSGIGIAEEERELVFQTYKQAESKSKHESGYGLGLPISMRLVKLLEGDIWFESVLGQGTTFFIKLPSVK